MLASIQGNVFQDHNHDGIRQSTDQSLPGWEVYLDQNNNGRLDRAAQVQSIVYSGGPVMVLPGQDARLGIDVPAMSERVSRIDVSVNISRGNLGLTSLVLAYPNRPFGVLLKENDNIAGNQMVRTTFSEAGTQWIYQSSPPYTGIYKTNGDMNRPVREFQSGLWELVVSNYQSSTETVQLDSWSLTIYTCEPTRTADTNGAFVFADLPPGNYSLRQANYPGWIQTRPIQGYQYQLSQNQQVTSAVFGSDFLNGTVRGTIFHDYNGDDIRDPGESGVEGFQVYLDVNDNQKLDSSEPWNYTDSLGNYTIDGSEPGLYKVRTVLQPGWQSSGSPNNAFAKSPAPSSTTTQTLTVAEKLAASQAPADRKSYVPNEILVRVRDGVDATEVDNLLASLGAKRLEVYRSLGLQRWSIGIERNLSSVLAILAKDVRIDWAEPNAVRQATAVIPNDLDFNRQWALSNPGPTVLPDSKLDADIDATDAWAVTTGSKTPIVAILDSGVDYRHPDLASNMWTNLGELPDNGLDDDGNGFIDDYRGYDFYNDDPDPMDVWYHGTHIAGIIGARGNDSRGVTGINWRTSLMPLNVMGNGGAVRESSTIAAIDYAILMGASVINASFGSFGISFGEKFAIEKARDAGLLVVAAAGNIGINALSYPASYTTDNIISVAASSYDDRRAYFSTFGLPQVDLAAPGVDIYSTNLGGGYRLSSGTSMSTPMVVGAAALVLSRNPELTYSQVRSILFDTVDVSTDLTPFVATGGRLNVDRAIRAVPTTDYRIARVTPNDVASGFTMGISLKDRTYFGATTPSGQRELWVSDGTPGGTVLFRDLSGTVSSNPDSFLKFGNKTLFVANHSNGERELFITDGSFTKTGLLVDLGNNVSSDPKNLFLFARKVYFTALNAAGQRELYVTDGTALGTQLVQDVSGPDRSSDPDDFVVYKGRLYFSAMGSNGQRGLYSTDGTTAGTTSLFATSFADPRQLTVYQGKLFFSAQMPDSQGTQRELFFSDGTTNGTRLFNDLFGSVSSSPQDFVVYNGSLYFSANGPQGRELYVTELAASSTRLFIDLFGASEAAPQGMFAASGKLFFTVLLADRRQRELYVTDGTIAGTLVVKNLAGSESANPSNFYAVGQKLWFTAATNANERELYTSDGTSLGTVLLKNFVGSGNPTRGVNLPTTRTRLNASRVDAVMAAANVSWEDQQRRKRLLIAESTPKT